jgi:hypothetical protein
VSSGGHGHFLDTTGVSILRFSGRICHVLNKPFVLLLSALLLLVLFTPGFALDEEEEPSWPPAAPISEEPLKNRSELNRENTNRGQTGETTKTTFRMEHYMTGGVAVRMFKVSLVKAFRDIRHVHRDYFCNC